MRSVKKRIAEVALSLMPYIMIIVLAGDLLYLYYAGAWTDPNRFILIQEIIALYALILFGLWGTYRKCKEVYRANEETNS